MLSIILILILLYILWKIAKWGWGGYRVYKQWKDATDGLRGFGSGEQQRQPEDTPKKKKKIDPSVGEYVAFEEITTEVKVETSDTATKVSIEEQVEDAVWEELPPDNRRPNDKA